MKTRTMLEILAGIVITLLVASVIILSLNLTKINKNMEDAANKTKTQISLLQQSLIIMSNKNENVNNQINDLKTALATSENNIKNELANCETKTNTATKFKELDANINNLKIASDLLLSKTNSLNEKNIKDYADILSSLNNINKKLTALCLTVKDSDEELANKIKDLREIVISLEDGYQKIIIGHSIPEPVVVAVTVAQKQILPPARIEKKQNCFIRFFKFFLPKNGKYISPEESEEKYPYRFPLK